MKGDTLWNYIFGGHGPSASPGYTHGGGRCYI